MAVKLGEMLIKAGLLTPPKLQEALEYQKSNGGKLGFNLVKLGFVKEEDITRVLSQQYGVPAISLAKIEIDDAVVKLIPSEVAQKYLIMPVSRTGATLTIAMMDTTNVFAMDDIKFMTGYNVEPVVASEVSIKDSIDRYYGSIHALELKKVMDEMAHEEEQGLEVLEEEQEVELAETRLPQAGPIKIRMQPPSTHPATHSRLPLLPTLFGEKLVLRLLDTDT